MQVLANIPGELPGESPAVQVLANIPGELPGESPAVQVLANVPGELPGESPAVQGLANIPYTKQCLTSAISGFGRHSPSFHHSSRGLAPVPPVSLATPRGQGSPLRFDTQPTGWSVGSAPRHQGGIRKDCSASLLNLYKPSPLTPFRFPPKPNSAGLGQRPRKATRGKSGGAGFGQHPRRAARGKSGGAGFGQHPRRAARGKSGGAGFGQRPRKAGGEVRRCRVWPASPEEQAACRKIPAAARINPSCRRRR